MATCAHCGREASGFAMINDDHYCHGDGDVLSCYEIAVFERGIRENRIELDPDAWDRFQEALDRPPRYNRAVAELFERAARVHRGFREPPRR